MHSRPSIFPSPWSTASCGQHVFSYLTRAGAHTSTTSDDPGSCTTAAPISRSSDHDDNKQTNKEQSGADADAERMFVRVLRTALYNVLCTVQCSVLETLSTRLPSNSRAWGSQRADCGLHTRQSRPPAAPGVHPLHSRLQGRDVVLCSALQCSATGMRR